MALDNDDLIVVQKSGGGELRKAKISDIKPDVAELWTEDSGKLYPTAPGSTVEMGDVDAPNYQQGVRAETNAGNTTLTVYADSSTNSGSFVVYDGQASEKTRASINNDGSATFAGGVNGRYFYAVTPDGEWNSFINQGGSTNKNTVINNGSADVITFNNDGSASFAGKVEIGTITGNSALISINDDGVNPTIYTRNNNSSGPVFGGYGPGSNTVPTSTIGSDGSATFAGVVKKDTFDNTSDSGYGWRLDSGNTFGQFDIDCTSTVDDTAKVFRVYKGTNETIEFLAGGSASFLGGLASIDYYAGTTTVGKYTGTNVFFQSVRDNGNYFCWLGGTSSDVNAATSKILADGSATFARQVISTRYSQDSGLSVNYNGTDYGYALYDQTKLYAGIGLDGSATFAGKLQTQDVTIESAFSYTILKTDAVGFWSPDNWSFGPDVSDPSSAVITLNATDGSAAFAGLVNVGGNPDTAGESGAKIFPSGTVRTRSPGTSSSDILFEGYGGSDSNVKFRVTGDGSGTFASSVISGENPASGAAMGSRLTPAGTVQAARPSGMIWNGFTVGDATPTSVINTDGSATFAGDVQVGDNPTASATANGLMFRGRGGVIARSEYGTDNVFAGFVENNASETSIIKANGSASFASYIKSENHSEGQAYIGSTNKGINYGFLAASGEDVIAGITMDGKVTAKTFDLESLDPLP